MLKSKNCITPLSHHDQHEQYLSYKICFKMFFSYITYTKMLYISGLIDFCIIVKDRKGVPLSNVGVLFDL